MLDQREHGPDRFGCASLVCLEAFVNEIVSPPDVLEVGAPSLVPPDLIVGQFQPEFAALVVLQRGFVLVQMCTEASYVLRAGGLRPPALPAFRTLLGRSRQRG